MKNSKDRVLIIAEAGVNHNGDKQLAMDLVASAADAGADLVKFQTFIASDLASRSAGKAEYQIEQTGSDESQLEMLTKLELDHGFHFELIDECKSRGIGFLSTAFELSSLRFLAEEVKLEAFKIPSGEITNGPFLLQHARYKRPMILSTGMSTLSEVESALGVLAFGLLSDVSDIPGNGDFEKAYTSKCGQKLLLEFVTLLHCTSNYPASFDDVNLLAMDTMASAFGLQTGYSDHTQGIEVAIAAVARGARLIEKHFTLDRNLAGPDHQASLEPDELAAMVSGIRNVERAMGVSVKSPQLDEYSTRQVARKSLVAGAPIAKGEVFTVENLTTLRPGNGRSPMEYWKMLGVAAHKDYVTGEIV